MDRAKLLVTIILTDIPMTSKGLFHLMTWMSPSFPVGAYTYSHGIEYAVEAGLLSSIDDLVPWLLDVVEFGSGWNDGILLAEAYKAVQKKNTKRLVEITEIGFACRPTKELALEATAQGRAFVSTAQAVFPSDDLTDLQSRWDGPIIYPVAVAVVAASQQVTLADTLTAYLHAFVSNLVSAAVRIIPLGQTDGQRAIAAVEGTVARQVEKALNASLDDMGTATLMVDWCSTQHETQYTRLFRS